MTARCGGGTSTARPGFGATVYMAPPAIGALFNNAPTPWAVVAAGFIGALTWELATFCNSDPPAIPTFTAADIEAILSPMDLIPFAAASSKFRDLAGALVWNDLCECTSGATPTSPTLPSAPSGAPTINPPTVGPSYPSGQPCFTYSYEDVGSVGGSITITTPSIPIDGITYASIDGQYTIPTPFVGGETTSAQILFFNSSGGSTGNFAVGAGTFGQVNNQQGAVPANTVSYALRRTLINQTSNGVIQDAQVNMYCGTTPGGGGGVPTPCPTDPFTLAILDQILALVTVIQRQAAPFAYVASTAHSGLTGSGHLDVQGLLGVKVQLDSYGSAVGVESGDPAEFFEAGWIVWQNADGGTTREHITHSPFISLPDLAGQFTRIGYTLGEGVSATITELVRES